MQLKIKTEKLKEMVSRVIKGAGNNKLIPITSLMAVELKDNVLTLITTDATNYLYIKEDKVDGDDFYVVVPVEKFSKLIARLTCETVTLAISKKMNVLEVKGNGNYNIELPMDEEGETIKYPNPISDVELGEDTATELNATTIRAILTSVKPALATTLEIPCYAGYYVGDKVVGTDTYNIASMAVSVAEQPMLISQELMNLLDVMTDEKIKMFVLDDVVVFETPSCVVYGNKMEGIENYELSIGKINELVETDFKSTCKVSKSGLLQVLDRLSLFVGTYDKNGINLTFTKEGLQVSSKSSSGVEILNYIENSNFHNFSCMIDIGSLTAQIKAQVSDVVTICYGEDNAIKMLDGNLTQIIALMGEE